MKTPYLPLSARGRGNRRSRRMRSSRLGSIPAWAGEPPHDRTTGTGPRVYPRVGGGTYGHRPGCALFAGLSPRGRGNPTKIPALQGFLGSIPAWAGEPPVCTLPPPGQRVYPRVGGGTGARPAAHGTARGLSPRGRGNPLLPPVLQILSRSIPAWAGEPYKAVRTQQHWRVYPRVGGGTYVSYSVSHKKHGLSPRGRASTCSRPN